MLRHKPSYYRSRDPVHNLKIKVTIRKVKPAGHRAGAVMLEDEEDEDEVDDEDDSSSDEEEEKDDDDSDDSSDDEEERKKKQKEKRKKKAQRAKAKKKKKAQKKKQRELKKAQKLAQNGGIQTDPDIGAKPVEAVFSWQEKEFSPREILLYRPPEDDEDEAAAAANRKRRKRSNIVERGYEHKLASSDKKARQIENEDGSLSNFHLFTYTDKDGFVPEQSYAPATGSASGIQHVGQAVVDLPRYVFDFFS
jgi:hypothetical protein